MALTRKFLSTLGIEADKVEEIIERHSETVNALKEESEKYKADAEKLEATSKELDELRKTVESNSSDEYKTKCEEIQKEFDAFKAEIATKEIKQNKEMAYKKLLRDAGVSDKRIDTVLKVTDLDKLELNESGELTDADKLTEGIKAEWGDFIVTTQKSGANVATPPANNGGNTMTKAEIVKIKDPIARQQAIAENSSLFGI